MTSSSNLYSSEPNTIPSNQTHVTMSVTIVAIRWCSMSRSSSRLPDRPQHRRLLHQGCRHVSNLEFINQARRFRRARYKPFHCRLFRYCCRFTAVIGNSNGKVQRNFSMPLADGWSRERGEHNTRCRPSRLNDCGIRGGTENGYGRVWQEA